MKEAVQLSEMQGEHRTSVPLRVTFFLTGVVFPVICLVAAYRGVNSVAEMPWQSGQLRHYVALLSRDIRGWHELSRLSTEF